MCGPQIICLHRDGAGEFAAGLKNSLRSATCFAHAKRFGESQLISELTDSDSRTPSPPWGYSRLCTLTRDRQIEVVAQFHAHRIRPNRIAYRTGIDIALVEALIAGEVEAPRFAALLARHRRQRYRERMDSSSQERAGSRYELQQRIEREYRQEQDAPPAADGGFSPLRKLPE